MKQNKRPQGGWYVQAELETCSGRSELQGKLQLKHVNNVELMYEIDRPTGKEIRTLNQTAKS